MTPNRRLQRVRTAIDLFEFSRIVTCLYESDPQLDVLFQQSSDLIARWLPDSFRSQPCSTDGVGFGERTGTAFIETLAKKERVRAKTNARSPTPFDLGTSNQEADFVRYQLEDK